MRARICSIGVLLPSVLAIAPGCSHRSDNPLCFPVRGQLFYNGKPMVGAKVFFHPLPASQNGSQAHMPGANVEKDGSFQLSSYELHDGAPAGEYAVTVIWTGESGGPGPDLLRNRYGDANRPVAKITVQADDVQLDPFQLKGPPVNVDAASKLP